MERRQHQSINKPSRINERLARKHSTKERLGVLATAGVIAVGGLLHGAWQMIEGWRFLNTDTESFVVDNPGCAPLIPAELIFDERGSNQEALANKSAVEQERAGTSSAANKFDIMDFNLVTTTGQIIEMASQQNQTFTTVESGIQIYITSPNFGARVGNTETYEELLHASLYAAEHLRHPEAKQLFTCFKKRVLDKKELSGHIYPNALVPYPHSCLENLRIADITDSTTTDFNEVCQMRGMTIPKINNLGEPLFASVLTPGILPSLVEQEGLSDQDLRKLVQQKLARLVIHEAIHFFMTALGSDYRINKDEAVIDELTDQVIKSMYPNGLPDNWLILPDNYNQQIQLTPSIEIDLVAYETVKNLLGFTS